MSTRLSPQEFAKLRLLVEALLERTSTGAVTWQPTDRPGSYAYTGQLGSLLLQGPPGGHIGDLGLSFANVLTGITLRLLDDRGQDQIAYSTPDRSMLDVGTMTMHDPALDDLLRELFGQVNGSVESRLDALDAWIHAVADGA